MIDAQILIAKGEREDLSRRPSILSALDYLTREPIVVTSCDVARNRSTLVQLALSGTDADVLFSIDPDVRFEEWQMAAVVSRVRETKGVVGGLYSHERTAYNFSPRGAHTLPVGKTRKQRFHVGPLSPQGPTLVDAVGTGFLAAHRSVYEKIWRKIPSLRLVGQSSDAHWYYPRMLPAVGGNHCLSTDYSFCSYAREVGARVEILPNVALGHRGEEWWAPFKSEPVAGFGELNTTTQGFLQRVVKSRKRK